MPETKDDLVARIQNLTGLTLTEAEPATETEAEYYLLTPTNFNVGRITLVLSRFGEGDWRVGATAPNLDALRRLTS